MIEVGKKAPPFQLADEDGKLVSLDSWKGKWVVLYFYPRDDTPGCTVEACDFTASIEELEGLRATVVGISPDSPESHKRFIEKHRLRVKLLSDPDHQVLEPYGAWGEKVLYGKRSTGVIRSTALIDPAGKVAFHWPKVQAKGHAAAVQEKLRELAGA